jgi:6-pyruvoyl-tetrahydropterin synthase
VTVRGAIDHVSGMIVDFGVMKKEVGGWIDRYWDHRVILQDTDPYGAALGAVVNYAEQEINIMAVPPTAENMASFLARITEELGYQGVSVEMHETPNCSAGWAG